MTPIKKPPPRPRPRPGPAIQPRIPQHGQRQDSLENQLRDLYALANRIGCYDAADWIWKNGIQDYGLQSCQ